MEKNLGHATAYGYAKSKGYSGTEDEFAELMADYASVGQSAAQSAEQAAASATSASASAQTATQAAQTATSKASEAVTAAGTATTKASEASQSASTASAAATSASTSAQTATTAATTATTKASEASESAATATTAKNDAESARDAAAQSASEAAESARTLTIDTTLTQSGQAADSKAVGDDIGRLRGDLLHYANTVFTNADTIASRTGFVYKIDNGVLTVSPNPSGYWKTLIAPINGLFSEGTAKLLTGGISGNASQFIPTYCFIDENWNVLGTPVYTSIGAGHVFNASDIPAGAVYMVCHYSQNFTFRYSAIAKYGDAIRALYGRKNYIFASLITGYNGYINYDTVNGTITIPRDTVYIEYGVNANVTYKLLNTADDIVLTGITYSDLRTSAIKLVLNVSTWVFSVKGYAEALSENERLVATIRLKHAAYAPAISSPTPWSIDGKQYGIELPDTSIYVKSAGLMNSVNHRGWYQAPENTTPAYKQSKQHGIKYVETDVQFTSDGVPVLLHDATINRTARNSDGSTLSSTINIADITYAQALTYDFGIYKGAEYAGTQIPKFEDFIILCKNLGLIPYVELKADATYTQAQITGLVDIVNRNGMRDNVVWISMSGTYLGYIKNYDSKARLGLVLVQDVTSANISTLENLKTADNSVFADVDYTKITSAGITLCYNADIPLEVWTVDTTSDVISLDPYITGVTSDNLIAAEILYNANII